MPDRYGEVPRQPSRLLVPKRLCRAIGLDDDDLAIGSGWSPDYGKYGQEVERSSRSICRSARTRGRGAGWLQTKRVEFNHCRPTFAALEWL